MVDVGHARTVAIVSVANMNLRKDTLVEHLDIERIELIYNLVVDMQDSESISDRDKAFLMGAKDALMSILGERNKLTTFIGADIEDEENPFYDEMFLDTIYKDIPYQ